MSEETGFESLDFQCEYCDRAFASERGRKRHVTMTHGRDHGDDSEESAPKAEKSEFPREHQLIRDTSGTIRYVAPNKAMQRIGDTLTSNITTVGAMTAMFAPVTGMTVVSRSPMLTKGLMELGSKNPAVMDGIKRFNTMFTGGELVTALASVGVAVAVDSRMLPRDGRIPNILIGDVLAQLPPTSASQFAPSVVATEEE